MLEQKNLLLAIVFSVAIILLFQFLVEGPRMERKREAARPVTTTDEQVATPQPTPGAPAISAPGAPTTSGAAAPGVAEREAILGQTPRLVIETPKLRGSITLKGGRIDDLILSEYREGLEPNSDQIVLLSPKAGPSAYFAEFGWVTASGGPAVAGADTLWRADTNATLGLGQPVTLSWDNGAGLRFSRTYEIDDKYMFTISERVENTSTASAVLYPYGLVSRSGTPEVSGFFILHEGPLGVFNGTLKEVDYDDLKDDGNVELASTGGWIGITGKYWLVALVPEQDRENKNRFAYFQNEGRDNYQTDYVDTGGYTLPPGGSIEHRSRLFAGAKLVRYIDGYKENEGIQRFDLAIDWGWFYFLTKPIFYLLDYLNEQIGNFGVAILLLTVLIKLLFFPLANRSYRAMSKMKKLQPEMTKLRERFSDDKQRLNQELMALYKKEKANPVSGCLPIIIQIPVFFALYKVLFVTIEMRHAPFFGWIKDLSAVDPYTVFNLFGLIPWQPPDILMIGIWPLIMGGTMFLQQRLNPQPPDPVQAKIFMILPLVFTVMLARFPVGLVIYWAWNNLLSIAQQWVIMRRMGVKI